MSNNVEVDGENVGDFYLSLYRSTANHAMRLEDRVKALERGLRLAIQHVDSPRVRTRLQRVLGGMKDAD